MDIQSALVVVMMTAGTGTGDAPRAYTIIQQIMPGLECEDYIAKHTYTGDAGPVTTFMDKPVLMAQYSCATITKGMIKDINKIEEQN